MKKHAPAILTLGLCALSIPAAHAAGVLVDPGFEGVTLVDDGNGVGKWNPFSNGSATSLVVPTSPRTGSDHLQLTLGGAANQFAGVFQDVSVLAGEEITVSLWHSATDNSPSAIEIRIEWLESMGNTEISRTGNSTPSPGATYEMFTLTETAPAGADTARVVYAAQSFGGNPAAVVNVDDVTVTGVPEPSSSMLLGLCALGLAARRRRQ